MRITGTERRELILQAARRVFSVHGYEGAKTMQIAREAKVSEALVYRHYSSKLSLYRAVLRKIFREQDESYRLFTVESSGAEGVVRSIKAYFDGILLDSETAFQSGYRMTLASLAGDGSFASLIYRRSQRKNLRAMFDAYQQARADGDIVGEALSQANTSMFIEHVGTMMNSIYALPPSSRPYDKSGAELVREAVWFCCRGTGMTNEAIARYIDQQPREQTG